MRLLIPFAPFLTVFGIVWITCWFNSSNRKQVQETLPAAINQKQPYIGVIKQRGRPERILFFNNIKNIRKSA
jgi:hypothetical protein